PEAVAAVAGCASKRAGVPPGGGILAPGEGGGNAAGGQPRRPGGGAVGPPPQGGKAETPPPGGPRPPPFVWAGNPPAEHHRQCERPRKQDAPGWAARPGPHADQRKSAAAHGTNLRIRTHEPIVQVANRLALLPPNALFRASAVPG